ncbi:MAG TPA: helix-turn-helix transcriptional regulator [Dehalococcoidia bacterium]|nr:helix-turn-helix transcriptional regulator [Dehalococcoidia bacterium]
MQRRDPDVLTPREQQVLALLKRGYSNRDIANELQITLSGAKYHVSEIISKLGVVSREEAATWRPQRGAALAPMAALFARQGAGMKAAVLATGAAVITIALVVLIAVAAARGHRSIELGGALQPSPTPTETAEVQPQIASVGPHMVGYIIGGGEFAGLNGNALKLTKQAGPGENTYIIDDQTRFLWAVGESIRFDKSKDGLRDQVFVAVALDSPLNNDLAVGGDLAQETGTPVDTVIIGYFKRIDGIVVDFGANYVDFRIRPELEDGIGTSLRSTNGVHRVWIDSRAEILDSTGPVSRGSGLGQAPDGEPQEQGLRPGLTVAFSGLINTDRDPVAFSLSIY